MRTALALVLAVSACGSDDRAPSVSGERPSGMSAPPAMVGQGASAASGGVARVGTVRLIPSLMRAPSMGEPAPPDTLVSFEGTPIALRDGTFDPGDRSGWFTITRGSMRVLANVAPSLGELTLPLVHQSAEGAPRGDRATVVLQVLDGSGVPLVGVVGAPKPGVIGPCYDNSTDAMNDKLPATGGRGAVAYLGIDPRAGSTFRVELTHAGEPIVAQVPIVGGTVTMLRATLR